MKVSDFSENDEMVWKEIKDLTAWKAGPRPGPGRRVGVAARPGCPTRRDPAPLRGDRGAGPTSHAEMQRAQRRQNDLQKAQSWTTRTS